VTKGRRVKQEHRDHQDRQDLEVSQGFQEARELRDKQDLPVRLVDLGHRDSEANKDQLEHLVIGDSRENLVYLALQAQVVSQGILASKDLPVRLVLLAKQDL
jgi:hypothetical protein